MGGSPKDGLVYTPFTTLEGILEKDTGEDPFNAPAKQLEEIRQRHPNTRITLIDDSTTYTAASYHSAMETLYEGAALAVIVVFLFLRNWRATLIAAVGAGPGTAVRRLALDLPCPQPVKSPPCELSGGAGSCRTGPVSLSGEQHGTSYRRRLPGKTG